MITIKQIRKNKIGFNTQINICNAQISALQLIKQPITSQLFHKQTKIVKRLLICLDVLLRIKSQHYIAATGLYYNSIPKKDNRENYQATSEVYREVIANKNKIDVCDTLQKVEEKAQLNCKVCANGAAFCSLLRLGDQISLTRKEITKTDFDDTIVTAFHEKGLIELLKYFSEKELLLIEWLFEGWPVHHDVYKTIKKDEEHRLFSTAAENNDFETVEQFLYTMQNNERLQWIFNHFFINNGLNLHAASIEINNKI